MLGNNCKFVHNELHSVVSISVYDFYTPYHSKEPELRARRQAEHFISLVFVITEFVLTGVLNNRSNCRTLK